MKTRSRLLGLAFAAADALVEVDATGKVVFAVGAAPEAGAPSPEAWLGKPLDTLVGRVARDAVKAMLTDLRPGVRSEPVTVLVAANQDRVRRATLRAFLLPDLAPAVSCAVAYEGSAFTLALPSPPAMLDAEAFLSRARETLQDAGTPLAVAFVDVPGLSGGDEAARRARKRVEAALQAASIDGSSAGQLTPERFTVLTADTPEALAAEVRDAGAAEGVTLTPVASASALPPGPPVNLLRALRVTLEACLRDDPPADPTVSFEARLKETVQQAERFRRTVRTRDFALHYQPIVALDSGAVHHFEALARFPDGAPGTVIPLAEELGLIQDFDLAVLEKAIIQLRRPGYGLVRIAVNVSAASMASDAYVDALLRLTANTTDDRRRLMVEVTETAALADPAGAERRLKRLRSAGVKVCIDDFGVGSAGFDHLRRLTVDVVKIDGSFIADLDTNARSRMLVGHLVELCADLKVTTIAEMIETEAVADAARALGVHQGQGWLFGRPAPAPVTTTAARPPARRVGAVAGWG